MIYFHNSYMKKLFLLLLLTIAVNVQAQLRPFHMSQVRLEESRWRDNMVRDSAWMCSFTTQQLLHSMRTTAGVYSAYEGGYDAFPKMGGWESLDCDLRGHAVGHLLSAFAYMYAGTGEEIFRLKGDSIVQGIRECQRMIGTGYVSAFPEGLINRNLQGKSVWAPWYTLHKLMMGLRMQHELAGNDTAAVILRDFTDWALRKLNGADRGKVLRNEFGGIAEAIPELHDFFYHADKIDPLYAGNFDMGTLHCNTFLPKVVVESQCSDEGRRMADAFFREMVAHHCYASGSLSDKEHFFPPETMSRHLSGYTGESCCTYNMLRLVRTLYPYQHNDPIYMDYYERALVNHILGQQDPKSGMVHYFLPMLTGAYKLYSTPMHSFWCCVGSGFESHARYAESVYWHATDTLYVNLFIPTTLTWHEQGLTLTQQTDFPRSDATQLLIREAPARRQTIRIRVPSWCTEPVVCTINGKRQKVQPDQGYCTLTRQWSKGDCVYFRFPMSLRKEYTPDSTRVAYLYGPLLLAGRLGRVEHPFSDPTKHNDYYTFNFQVPDSIKSLPASSLHPVSDFAEFETVDGIRVSPLYDIHHERYVVYWTVK